MNEPIYEYKKGHGWVVIPQHQIVLKCGTVVRLEYRQPKKGETYMALLRGTLRTHKTLEQYFIDRATSRSFTRLSTKTGDCDNDFDYCTVIPL